MTQVFGEIIGSADYFILLMLRAGGLIISSPIFGRINIPATAKIGLATAIGYLFFTMFPQTEAIVYSTAIEFFLLCFMEILLGIALAWVTNVAFTVAAYTSGHIIDMQIGFGIVNVYDAQNRMQAPMMGNVINFLMLILFFSTGGHQKLIEMMYLTIQRMPVGTLTLSPNVGYTALEIFTRSFVLGIMMSMPIIAAGLTLEIIFGLLMRAVPQIHMFVVGIPLKMIVGLIVFTATLPAFAGFSARIFEEMFNSIEKMFAMFVRA